MASFTFLVQGKPVASRSGGPAPQPPSEFPVGTVKQAVQISTLRGKDTMVSVTATTGEDVVVLQFQHGPTLVLHPENARDLFMAQAGGLDLHSPEKKRDGDDNGPGASDGTRDDAEGDGERALIRIPATLAWDQAPLPSAQRGIGDKVVLTGIQILTGVGTDKLAGLTADAIVEKVDAQVDPGVYALDPNAIGQLKGTAPLAMIPAAPDGQPLLVLVHGTFSNTEGTFGKLWAVEQKDPVRELFRHYGGRVYALDHPTLGASPIANALMLAKALPAGARVHLLTHSRGGLVAEVLARAASLPGLALTAADEEAFDSIGDQLAELRELVQVLQQKQVQVQVERVVRVACPARGTLLASKRLDAYLSVFKWVLESAQIPVLPALVDFLGEVARKRTDPEEIPGLAAQMPNSPLVQWLHAAPSPVRGQLRVVAGDVQGDSVVSWLKTLVSDAYYWQDNDFVVQTSSMYGGAPREAGASFMLSRGGKVSHFSYFSTPETAKAVVSALRDDVPQGFRVIGPLSAAGQDFSGLRGTAMPKPERPAVIMLPGILGSNLKVGSKRIWLGWGLVNGLDEIAYTAAGDSVTPDGMVGRVYEKLCNFLSVTHEVVEFAFDWRKPIEQEAERLARLIEAHLLARDKTGQPVRLLAHSMGGIVARVMQLRCPEVWARMMARPGARLLMLGTPNGGSWAPMQVLSGDDSFGNTLVSVGAPFQDRKARALMASFPGLLQLQAGLLDPVLGLGRHERWKEIADKDRAIVKQKSFWHHLKLQIESFAWGIPPQDVLDQAVKLRAQLDAQRDKLAGGGSVVMVLGRAKSTPAGYQYGEDGLVYLDAPEQGDGRVTLESALLPGVPAWQIDCVHGDLPGEEQAFDAYLELLERGSTTRLGSQIDVAARLAAVLDRTALVPNRGLRRAAPVEPDEYDRLSSESRFRPVTDKPALLVTVVNGNLKFVRQPVMLGHYRSLQLEGAEKVMDRMIGGGMSESMRLGQYPDALCTHQIFLNLGENAENPLQLPRPEGVIIVGLGPESELKASQLSATVTHGVLAWAQRLAELHRTPPEGFELAATLIGSGGSGMSAGLAARAIVKGVSDANRSLATSRWPVVSHLHLVEMYLDRATEAWRAAGLLAASARGAYRLTDRIVPGAGALRHALDTGYRGASYDLLTARSCKDDEGKTSIEYTLDTKRAREDVRAQGLQGPLIEMLVRNASNDARHDPRLGFTLFKLLVPPEMEPFLGGTSDMQIQLDEGTSGIPWEMLDTCAGTRRDSDPHPWAIRVKLLRSLRTADFYQTVQDAGRHDGILLIGEPDCRPKEYPGLPAARAEVIGINKTLTDAGLGANVKMLVNTDAKGRGPNAFAVVNALFERDWRIIHIAGHGMPGARDSYGGVVLSDETVFGTSEIATMRVVPSLVFVNCCHLAAQDPAKLIKESSTSLLNRARFAASVAEELIKKGVRCVIAAGWAVSDSGAQIFATSFYKHLAANERFIDAVAAARSATYDPNDNTWAAYQCYGDPDWRLRQADDPVERVDLSLADEFASVCSAPSLVLALESIITRTRFEDQPHASSALKVFYLEQRFGEQYGNVGAVAEMFGIAWAEARDLVRAIKWHEQARKAPDGSASIRSAEQLGSLLARTAWEHVRDLHQDLPPATSDSDSDSDKVKREEALREARLRLAEAIRDARPALDRGLGMLDQLNEIQPTAERESLCASAYKRKLMLERLALQYPLPDGLDGASAREMTRQLNKLKPWLEAMEKHYANAEKKERTNSRPDWYYPALNRLAAALIREGRKGWRPESGDIAAIQSCIKSKINADADFYSVAAGIELDFYLALAEARVATEQARLLAQFDDLYQRVQAPRWWNSVRDQLDFVVSHCFADTRGKDTADDAEYQACKRILARLAEIAPRSRTPEPERVPRDYPAFV